MIDPAKTAVPDTSTTPQVTVRTLARYFGVAALLAVTALGIAVWYAQDTRREMDALRQDVARKLSEAETQSKADRILADQLREATREASVKVGVLENKLAESQNQQIALEALYQDLSRNRDEWAYAEIEQTLLVASQQLQLAGNVKAALIALQAVDMRLTGMNRPQLAPLRKVINQDIARLKSLPLVDTAGVSARIDNLVTAVDRWPLIEETRSVAQPAPAAPAADEAAWKRYGRELWDDLRQLVRVQRMDRNEVPLLTPSQSFFLRENLKLRLLSARLALLARDSASFRNDMKSARDWLARYFDTRDKSVANAAATLASLQASEVTIDLLDISATLDALRAVRQTRERIK